MRRFTTVMMLVCMVGLSIPVAPAFGQDATASVSATPTTPVEETAAPVDEPMPEVDSQVAALATTATPAVRAEDDHSRVRFSGTWGFRSSESWSGGSARAARVKGASATVKFNGTSVAWISAVGPDRGIATVYLDGTAVARVDLYAPSHMPGVVAWTSPELPAGLHTVRVVATGSRTASATATWVTVDAFDLHGALVYPGSLPGVRVENGDSRLYQTKSAWIRDKRSTAFGRSAVRSVKSGSSITIKFKGTAVTWYGRKSPSSGRATVYLDGRKVATISQFASPTAEPRVAWATSGLRNKVHTLRIRCDGVPGTAGGGTRTEFDAFQVSGTVLTAPRPTPFKYPWKTYIVIDKSQFRLYFVKNKMLIKSYPIAHGKASTPTPNHVWRIDAKYPHTGGVYGPRKMRMFRGYKTSTGWRFVHTAYGIHGTNQEWVIGTRASHGCIRMYNKDVTELYPQVPMHTIVITRN